MSDENESTQPAVTKPKQNRGFRAMSPEKQREIASKGGKASHVKGTGHTWTSAEAIEAGRKGGRAARGKRKLASGTAEPASGE